MRALGVILALAVVGCPKPPITYGTTAFETSEYHENGVFVADARIAVELEIGGVPVAPWAAWRFDGVGHFAVLCLDLPSGEFCVKARKRPDDPPVFSVGVPNAED